MFTGIIEFQSTLRNIHDHGSGKTFHFESEISSDLKIDQSVSHNGVCLTIESVEGNQYQVTAIKETLDKTSLSSWLEGAQVNLERCMQMNGRLDGHMVQGHVDRVSECLERIDLDGSHKFWFVLPEEDQSLIVEQGSICLNGVSLTVSGLEKDRFSVDIIPYTLENTNFNQLQPGMHVNLEFDVIGKYVQRQLDLRA